MRSNNWKGGRVKRTSVEDLVKILKKSALHREKEVEKKLKRCLETIDFVTWRILAKVMIEYFEKMNKKEIK